MSLEDIRSACATILRSISGVVNVHDVHDRVISDEEGMYEFDSYYKDERTHINCWEINAEKAGGEPYACSVAEHFYKITITARRTNSSSYGTRKELENDVATVHETFLKNRSLNNTSEPTEVDAPSEIYYDDYGGEPDCLHCDFVINASILEHNVTWS